MRRFPVFAPFSGTSTAPCFASEKANFARTFAVLSASLGAKAFAYANPARNDLTRAFSFYHYEAITLGVQKKIENLDPSAADQMEALREVLMEVKLDEGFIRMTTGGGKNSPGQLRDRIFFVESKMERL